MEFYMRFLSSVMLLALLASCSMTSPVSVSSNSVGRKSGKACVKHLFGFIPLGDTGITIAKAAKNGGISKVSSVDYSYTNYLLLSKSCTMVNGN